MSRLHRCPVAALLVGAVWISMLLGARAETAPHVRPWVPPTADSLVSWAEEARVGFRDQSSDVVDSTTIQPFVWVGTIARRYLESLGRPHVREAGAVKTALDSLGFDTELVSDPVLDSFLFLVVRNPFRLTSQAVGFFFWFRGDDLLQQAMALPGGQRPAMRVWWNNDAQAPYEWGLVDRSRGAAPRLRFYLMRLTEDGGFWRPAQYEGRGPDLGEAHEARWVDVNGDGLPELVVFARAAPDPLFTECSGCPTRLVERIYTERKGEGFSLHDSRLVPTPYSIFVLFINLLLEKNHAAAARLLEQPAMLSQALGLGWGVRRAPGTWSLEYTDNDNWPHWLGFRFLSAHGAEHFVVRFTQKDERWIIQDWKRPVTARAAAADSSR